MDNYKTIKELADELHISKQAVWQKIKRNKSTDLRKFMTTKGNTVYVDVYGQKIIMDMFDSSFEEKSINANDIKVDDVVNVDDSKDLNEEVQFLRNLVDKLQIEKSELHKIVDQQQQLTLQSNKQIEQLQNQLMLLAPQKEESEKEEVVSDTDSQNVVEEEDLQVESVEEDRDEKKWWQFWR